MCVCVCQCVYIYIYIYMYRERERCIYVYTYILLFNLSCGFNVPIISSTLLLAGPPLLYQLEELLLDAAGLLAQHVPLVLHLYMCMYIYIYII